MVWVANRIRIIQTSTEVNNWHYVPTSENPSDISSRGMNLTELVKSDLFFHGPKWLTNKQVQFKTVGEISEEQMSLDSEEVKKAVQMKGPQMNMLFASLDEEDDVIRDILQRHNHWKKSVNIIAWIQRFLQNLKQRHGECHLNPHAHNIRSHPKMKLRNKTKPKQTSLNQINELYLDPEEVTSTENMLFKYAQSREFSEEISLLSDGLEVPRSLI